MKTTWILQTWFYKSSDEEYRPPDEELRIGPMMNHHEFFMIEQEIISFEKWLGGWPRMQRVWVEKKLWEGHAAMVSSWWEVDTDQSQDQDPGGGGDDMISSLALNGS
jgi:hypothetical protein